MALDSANTGSGGGTLSQAAMAGSMATGPKGASDSSGTPYSLYSGGGTLSQASNVAQQNAGSQITSAGGGPRTAPLPRPVSPGGAPSAADPNSGSAATAGQGPGPGGSGQPVPALNSLYAQNPGANTFGASDRGQATATGAAPTASASKTGPLAGINTGQINPNDPTNAASQLDAITNANSPYIQLAKQQGLLSAAGRGLENSSLASGASEAAAVQAAAPLAEQNAGTASQGMLQEAQLGTQASEFNASQANANQQLNAQMQTQQTQFNASQQQQAAATNSAAQNAMTQQTQQLNEQINQQYLSGTQSQSLAAIQGQYNELIQQNASASGLYTSMLNNIGSVMANKDIAPQRVADTISAMQSLLGSGLSIIDAINGGTAGAPGTPAAGGGTQRTIQPVGAAGPTTASGGAANIFANEAPGAPTPASSAGGGSRAGGGAAGAVQTGAGVLGAAQSLKGLGVFGHAPAAAAPAGAAPAGAVDPAVSHGYASLSGIPESAPAAETAAGALPYATDAAGQAAATDLAGAQLLPSTEAAMGGGQTAVSGATMGAGVGAAAALAAPMAMVMAGQRSSAVSTNASYWKQFSDTLNNGFKTGNATLDANTTPAQRQSNFDQSIISLLAGGGQSSMGGVTSAQRLPPDVLAYAKSRGLDQAAQAMMTAGQGPQIRAGLAPTAVKQSQY